MMNSFLQLACVSAFTFACALPSHLCARDLPRLDLGSLQIETKYDAWATASDLEVQHNGRKKISSQREEIEAVPPDGRLRVAFLGGTFMDREARTGHLETELTRLWPDREIVFRNLAWPGDNVDGDARVGFGPGEYRRSGWQPPGEEKGDYGFRRMIHQIRRARPDVVFIAYGSTVAFKDEGGIKRFAAGMKRLLDALKSAHVRVVLLSPPPRESRGKNWPDMTAQNEKLSHVASYLRTLSAERSLHFVDVFAAFQKIASERHSRGEVISDARLTDNGIHLNDAGYRQLARVVSQALAPAENPWALSVSGGGSVARSSANRVDSIKLSEFGIRFTALADRLPSLANKSQRVLKFEGLDPGSYALDIGGRRIARGNASTWANGIEIGRGPDIEQAENLRQAIIEKNQLFFYEFRPQNAAYIYLFRRHERGHHEGEVAQFATLVQEREESISRLKRPRLRHYELVRETDYPDHEVPGREPEADIALELRSFEHPDELEVNLFAADPLVTKPICMHWDERGRLWVATSKIYPHLAPGQVPDDRILILEDIDGDGQADKSTVFADGLLVPQSVIPALGGAFVTQSTDLLFLKDNDGDDVADERRLIFTGFGNADVHHMIHGLRWGPGGDLYLTQSIYINSWIETPWGLRQLNGAGTWRLRPDNMRLEIHSRGLVNPWGHAFDRWGQSFSTDGAGGGGPAFTFSGSAYRTATGVSKLLETMNPGRPKECGLEVLSGRHFPEAWRGHLITSDFRANRVVRYGLSDKESAYSSRLLGDVLSSSHRSFRPVDTKMGPDGALYVADWYSPIIDHGEVDFHHPLRDNRHGRIWRVTVRNRALVTPPRIADATTESVIALLELPEDQARDQARRILRERGTDEVAEKLQTWIRGLDRNSDGYEHHRLEALWVMQGLRHVDEDLLRTVLASNSPHARAAAVSVLGDWHDSMPDAESLFKSAVGDEHPRVRLAAVNALRDLVRLSSAPRLVGLVSANIALRALDMPIDRELDYALWLTARELEPYWIHRLEQGKSVFEGNAHRLGFALSAARKQSALEPLVALLERGDIEGTERREALVLVASLGSPANVAMVLDEAMSQIIKSPEFATSIFDALVAGARSGNQPPPNANRVAELLALPDQRVVERGIHLAGQWQVEAARDELEKLSANAGVSPALRYEASVALGKLPSGLDTLRKLSGVSNAIDVRITATAARVAIDPERSASDAAILIAEAKNARSVEILLEAFVAYKGGDVLLARALEGKRIQATVAASGVRIAGSSGRKMEELIAELTRAGSLEPITKMPSTAELSALMSAVASDGDARRGETIFRRDALRCTTCHSLGGAGGKVGPDLSSLGGSSQIVHILEALLAPSAKIKQGYEAVVVFDQRGNAFSGTVVKQNKEELQLRDVRNRIVTIPTRRIQAVSGSEVSLMPEGMTQSLRRDELVDLVRFLSELGRPGPFSLPTERYLRTWRKLDPELAKTTATQGESIVKHAESLSWQSTFSRVDGSLPLGEVPALSNGQRCIRFALSVDRPTNLQFQDLEPIQIWVDGRKRRIATGTSIALDRGSHDCIIIIPADAEWLRVEMRDQ